MRIDISVLDELVHEYCIYRGIVDPGPTYSGLHVASGTENAEWGSSSTENCSIVTDSEISVSSGPLEVSQTKMDSVSTQNPDTEVRYPCETNSLSEDCSTSRERHDGDNRALQRNRSLGSGDRGKRKRWRGRDKSLGVASDNFTGSSFKGGLGVALLGGTNMDLEKSMMKNVTNRVDKYEIILGVKELACEGMAAEVVEEINV